MRILRQLALAFLLALAAVAPAHAVERILLFVSDAQVERNGDLIVIETIRVEAEGAQIRHGIFRDFPTTYTPPGRPRVVVGFDVQSVMRDGRQENWTTEAMSNGVRLRIGDANVTCRPGRTNMSFATVPIARSVSSRTMTSFIGTRPATAGRSSSTPPRPASRCRNRCRSGRPRSIPGRRARRAATP
jgi:hypothetical protein